MLPPALLKAQPLATRRLLHASSRWREITRLQMPAMSPTMTEGGIADWKKMEGDTFSAGEVLLEIETDKATIDVEAQEDGVMGKIIAQNGTKNIPVGKTIALLAQEGDDLANLQVPPEEPDSTTTSAASSSAPSPSAPQQLFPPSQSPTPSEALSHKTQLNHDRPYFPSVMRLLGENNVPDAEQIKGTGIRGMLTKGDVLTNLGKASSPSGTFKDNTPTPSVFKSQSVVQRTNPPAKKVLDAHGIRHAILSAFLDRSAKARATAPPLLPPTFESIVADYLPPTPMGTHVTPPASPPPEVSPDGYLDGLH